MKQRTKRLMALMMTASAGDTNPVGGMSNMDKLFMKVNVISGVVIGGIAILVIVLYILRKKKAAKAA